MKENIECPFCRTLVPRKLFNLHLDVCSSEPKINYDAYHLPIRAIRSMKPISQMERLEKFRKQRADLDQN